MQGVEEKKHAHEVSGIAATEGLSVRCTERGDRICWLAMQRRETCNMRLARGRGERRTYLESQTYPSNSTHVPSRIGSTKERNELL